MKNFDNSNVREKERGFSTDCYIYIRKHQITKGKLFTININHHVLMLEKLGILFSK